MEETHQRLEGLTGSIKHPDLDGAVLAPAEEQLSCLGQTQNSPLQPSGTCLELSVQLILFFVSLVVCHGRRHRFLHALLLRWFC